MPTIGNNPHTLLHGLSDFWVRFFADYDELNALYQGVEITLAQTYLDFLSSFLNISLLEAPILNTEYFKLLTLREDELTFVEGSNPDNDRYVAAMPDNVAVANLLQNKVLDPTAVLESGIAYTQDNTNYRLSFKDDPSGRSGLVIDQTDHGNLLTYGTALYTRLYTVTEGETPFAAARIGHWVQITNSASGNNNVFLIKEVIDSQNVLIEGALTLPELNNGNLKVELLETEFVSEPGFANRTVNLAVGGNFDDAALRATTSMSSWYFDAPKGLAIRKGDILRILGATDPAVRAAFPTLPVDFPITLVRQDKLYFAPTTNLFKDVSNVKYVILRTPNDNLVKEEFTVYTRRGVPKPTVPLYNASLIRSGDDTVLQLNPASPTTFAPSDQFRYVDITGGAPILWTATLDADGTLTRFGGTMATPLAIAAEGAILEISGSSYGQDGQYPIRVLDSETVCHIEGKFIPETVSVALVGMTNDGTYRLKRIIDSHNAVVDRPASCPDLANTTINWTIHDGYKVNLAHTRIVYDSLTQHGVTGNSYNGGYHVVREGEEYSVDYEAGIITQIGRFAGQWGLDPIEMANVTYRWLREVITERSTGSLKTTPITVPAREVALWAPDAQVDKYHLYNNFGQYIDRFAPSTETYRNFIRGIFQLYVLGPTLRHIESALNVIAGFPVARDDGEYLVSYDAISNPTLKQVTTRRVDGTNYTYVFDSNVVIRSDIVDWVPTDARLVFEAFEPFTDMFTVTDYVQDPVWWENIIIPQRLLPKETSERRTTIPLLYDNTINALDDPHIGDPGLFIGADDEGVVPPFITTYPAKRRKMANVVMNTFLKQHMFYVSFDTNLSKIATPAFVQDLRELILIAKPGYCLAYVEPASNFFDTMTLVDPNVQIHVTWDETDGVIVGNSLYIESSTWPIGRVFRQGAIVSGATLLIANGLTVPAPVSIAPYLSGFHVYPPAGITGFYGEPRDYAVDRYTGVLTPLTVWPAGTYLIDYRALVVSPTSSKNPALGDMDFLIGGLNPIAGHCQAEHYYGGTISAVGDYKVFTATDPVFATGVSEGARISVVGRVPFTVREVLTTYQCIVDAPETPVGTNLIWSFMSREPRDGQLIHQTDGWHLRTRSGMFRHFHKQQYLQIKDAMASGGVNNGYWPILDVFAASDILLGGAHVTESNLHWKLVGGGNMGILEQPLQIRVY